MVLNVLIYSSLSPSFPLYSFEEISNILSIETCVCSRVLSLQEKFEDSFGPNVGIPTANSTRWNSVHRQLKSVIDKGLAPLNAVSREAEHTECVFSHKEWDQLTELVEILEPFKDYTDQLQGEEVKSKI